MTIPSASPPTPTPSTGPQYRASDNLLRRGVLNRMERTGWDYASPTVPAIFELWRRVVDAAKNNRPITFSAWVSGIVFESPTVNGGAPHVIDTTRWTADDQRLAGDFANFMSARSYFESGALIGSFIVYGPINQPMPMFFEWAQKVGAIWLGNKSSVLAYWASQMSKSHEWYGRDPVVVTRPSMP